ncbi:hypothetical protein GF354_05975 [Candidatus Peregrinibacteria bacterium]|nr:hypothetical protein [Candidatus Peregrinibacteria bacterium]
METSERWGEDLKEVLLYELQETGMINNFALKELQSLTAKGEFSGFTDSEIKNYWPKQLKDHYANALHLMIEFNEFDNVEHIFDPGGDWDLEKAGFRRQKMAVSPNRSDQDEVLSTMQNHPDAFKYLRRLNLPFIDVESVRMLTNVKSLEILKELDFGDDDWVIRNPENIDDALKVIGESEAFPNLEELNLQNTNATIAGIEALTAARAMESLKEVLLQDTEMNSRFLRTLATRRRFPKLDSLHLANCGDITKRCPKTVQDLVKKGIDIIIS